MINDAERACSFCTKREPAVKLFAGPDVSLCQGLLRTWSDLRV